MGSEWFAKPVNRHKHEVIGLTMSAVLHELPSAGFMRYQFEAERPCPAADPGSKVRRGPQGLGKGRCWRRRLAPPVNDMMMQIIIPHLITSPRLLP
jgi:hypothetical protein